MNEDAIAIVLGRKGSSGFKNKNVMKILNKPAYEYAIDAAKKSKYINKIYFSTDIEEIISRSKELNINIIKRPKYLADNKALFDDALIYSYKKAKKMHKKSFKYVVILMANAVTINSKLIDKAIEALNHDPKADSAVTVSSFNMYSPIRARKITSNGYLNPFIPFKSFGKEISINCDRDSQGDAYFADMSHSVSRIRALDNIKEGMLPQKWMGKKIIPIINKDGCDIDEEWQIDMSIRWLKKNR